MECQIKNIFKFRLRRETLFGKITAIMGVCDCSRENMPRIGPESISKCRQKRAILL